MFRQAVKIDHDGVAVQFTPDDWQEADFRSLDQAWRYAVGLGEKPAIQRGWFERPRGHSKTSDMALMVCWALRYAKRRVRGIACAGDARQAGFLRDSIVSLLECNPWLVGARKGAAKPQYLHALGNKVTNRATGSELEILTSDAKTSFGDKADFVIVDEITHWEDTAEAKEFWASISSTSEKRGNCVMMVICNAGFTEHWTFKEREKIRSEPSWNFSRLNGPVSSWITKDRLDRQQRTMSWPSFDRLWLNNWTAGTGDALNQADILSSINQLGPMTGGEDGWIFFGGVDLSITKDTSAVVIVGKHAYGKVRLAAVRAWTPPRGGKVDLREVREEIVRLHRQYRTTFFYDVYQAHLLAQDVEKMGVWMEPVPFQGTAMQEMASAVIDAFTSHNIELFRDEPLLDDLKRLRVEERPSGFRLVADRTSAGHCDRATALCLALLAAKRCPGVLTMPGDGLVKAMREEEAAAPHGQSAHERLRYNYGQQRRRTMAYGAPTQSDDEDEPSSGWERQGVTF
jgi:phage terminase large subunit-like protein